MRYADVERTVCCTAVCAGQIADIYWSVTVAHILHPADATIMSYCLQHYKVKPPPYCTICTYVSTARFKFVVTAKHLPGKKSSIANSLSRFNMQVFCQLALHSQPVLVAIPPSLLYCGCTFPTNTGGYSPVLVLLNKHIVKYSV